jgi:hypothetical protein
LWGIPLPARPNAGAADGYIYDRHKKSEEEAYERGVKDGQSSQSQ